MIPYIYHPVLFKIGPISIYTWGLIAAFAFLISYLYVLKQTKNKKIHDLVFYILLGAIIGARLLNWVLYKYSFYEIFKLWQGGLDITGGFIGAFIFGIIYIKKNKLNFWRTTDILAPAVAIGIAIGRIACTFGDGGHLGKTTTFFMGTLADGVVRHYTAVYSVIAMSILFILLLILRKRKLFTGFLLTFSMIYYGVVRFLIDFTRADPTYLGLTIAQYGCFVLFILGLMVLIKKLNA